MSSHPLFDTHCHYNLSPLHENWRDHWQKAQDNGVKKSVVIGTDWQSISYALEIAAQEQNLYAAVGLHPNEFDQLVHESISTEEKFKEALSNMEKEDWENRFQLSNKKVVALGETGLDYFHLSQDTELSDEQKSWVVHLQKLAFKKHVLISQKNNLPLIIHVRDRAEQAYWDVLEILKQTKFTGKFNLHCISGPMAYVQEAIKMGAYIGIAGNVTYKNAENIRDLVRSVPADRTLLETDAPFLPPREFRGQMCEPWMVSKTAQFIEEELGVQLNQMWKNAHEFFSLQ